MKLAAPDVKTAASILMKRFAFLAVIHLYAMTVFDKRLDSKPGNIIVLDMYKEGLWLPEFRFTSWETVASRAGMRDGWKEDSIRYLFADNLSPLIDGLVKETKIPKLILWENIAIYIYWLYEKVLPGIAEERAAADFAYLLHSAPGNLFGDDHQSPLKKYYSETGMKALERPRRTCCFSYKVKGGDYCKICPVVCN
ncbi:IucA/IucC family C-terminal-domain containing protein [Bacillus sp. REN3]|uniref:IucA/IucC family C-terminal-domain containing protein n=1 Tax=Bacillus sp. REN3 TaxID=2802440 RepID=UPI001AED9EEB|nr:IucA/IucC family C-terminal-domain containing protein [Bacillus sp. REN3]